MPSLKGEGANRAGLGDIERSDRFVGRGGILGALAAESLLSWPLAGRGGITGGCCMAAAVIACVKMLEGSEKEKSRNKIREVVELRACKTMDGYEMGPRTTNNGSGLSD